MIRWTDGVRWLGPITSGERCVFCNTLIPSLLLSPYVYDVGYFCDAVCLEEWMDVIDAREGRE